MTTTQDALEAYKSAIRAQFEVEKGKHYSSFLIVPSRAQLRKLCVERFRNNSKPSDLRCFELFFGFEFSAGAKNKLQAATDKFRPIENFLKGATDLSDPEAINMAAILVDFNPRPFTKFSKSAIGTVEEVFGDLTKQEAETGIALSSASVNMEVQPIVNPVDKSFRKRNGILILAVVCVFLVGYTSKSLFFSDDCMQWNGDHYEKVSCTSAENRIGSVAEVTPYDDEVFELRKIAVCDTTAFFKGTKAVIWYCKVNGNPEYFTSHGLHPVTGKALRPVTNYIIDKYVKSCN